MCHSTLFAIGEPSSGPLVGGVRRSDPGRERPLSAPDGSLHRKYPVTGGIWSNVGLIQNCHPQPK